MEAALFEALLIVTVGLAVGWGATKSGLGVGLSLPILAVCGLALPAALLATKLPVAMGDLAAVLGERRRGGLSTPEVRPAPVCCASVAGASATWAVLHWPAWVCAAAVLLLAMVLGARGLPRRGGPALCHAAVWGAYVGGFGFGAGLLWRLAARDAGSGLALRAAANTGALGVLLLSGEVVTEDVCLLALAQGAGAWFATRTRNPIPPI